MKILANDGIDATGKELLEKAGFEVYTANIAQADLLTKLNDYDAILVRSATKVRKELIDASPNLKLIGRGGVGMDNIDVEYAKSKGIEVINTPAASSNSVAELVFAHLLSANRFLNKTNCEMHSLEFSRFKELKNECSKGTELFGKTIGIIGLGRIGKEVARIAIGMGMNVVAHDPFLDKAEIEIIFHNQLNISPVKVEIVTKSKEEVLAESDFISLHLPGGKGIIMGETEFAKLKKSAVLVNCARGGSVDELALNNALNSGQLAAAALDVFEKEPPEYMDILVNSKVSLSPHIGASTVEAQERIGEELASKIISFFKK
ncbi:MAG: 3-phosphoglycerate dehydrogenase [Flavobacteriales bacterium]|nr:3-phosphoglycerate dehydrogenase [Flavobacteriales bacterium]